MTNMAYKSFHKNLLNSAFFSFILSFILYTQQIGITNAEAQLTPGLYAFGFVVSCFVCGPLITRFGIRKVAMATSPGCLIGNCLIYIIPSTGYYWAILAEFIIALTCGAVYMLTTAGLSIL